MLIKVTKYEHFNKALPNWNTPQGRYIRTKKQYKEELARANCVPIAEGRELAAKAKQAGHRPYTLSRKAVEVIQAINNTKPDKHGKVTFSDRTIDGMREVGVNLKRPKDLGLKGGWE